MKKILIYTIEYVRYQNQGLKIECKFWNYQMMSVNKLLSTEIFTSNDESTYLFIYQYIKAIPFLFHLKKFEHQESISIILSINTIA